MRNHSDLTIGLSAACFRIEERILPCQLRSAVHVFQMRQALHMDGLSDEASARGLRHAAKAHLQDLRQEIQAQGLSLAPREPRSQIGGLASLLLEFVNASSGKRTKSVFREDAINTSNRNKNCPTVYIIDIAFG